MLAGLSACQDEIAAPATNGPSGQPWKTVGYPTRGPLGSGWIHGPDGQPMPVTYEVHDGRAIFEGDIDLGPAAEIAPTREALKPIGGEGPRFGVVISSSSRRWVSGTVAYVIDPSLPNQYRVTDAIAHIEANNPGVNFVPRYGHTDYVYIARGSGCSSPVGRQGGKQTLNLGDNCGTPAAIHEFMHALGMEHEHSRCDRDSYVQILLQNVQSGLESNFARRCSGYTDVFGYDEASIMHYSPYAASANGQPTIRSLRGLDHLMGSASAMSATDVTTVHWMYPPPVNLTATYPGGVPTLSWNAAPTATSYDLYLVESYYTNNIEGTRTWESRRLVGTTSGTSLQDAWASWTGMSQCDYSSPNELQWTDYYYELVTHFQSGVTKKSYASAEIGNC